jgi:hypothetical protein
MHRRAIALLLSTVSAGAAFAAGDSASNVVTQTRHLPAFSTLALDGVGTVRVHRGPQEVRVTIDRDLADRYQTVVSNGKLRIGFKFSLSFAALRAYRSLKRCEIDITVPELSRIELNGAGTIALDPFKYGKIELDINGEGRMELGGTASELVFKSTGNAKLRARDLAATSARVSMTGSGDAEVSVKQKLDASISGAGKLAYWGSPSISQSLQGAGQIRKAGE